MNLLAQKNENPLQKQRPSAATHKEVSFRYNPNEDFVDPTVETSFVKIRITEIIDDPDFD
ncbi:MAG: hypothetical protein ACXV5H_11425 [Halobacteriota archaeon]